MGEIKRFFKKLSVFAILILGFSTVMIFPKISLATEQEGEDVVYEGNQYPINEFPLDSYLKNQKPPLNLDALDTAHWRGYQASWVVKENALFLNSLEARIGGKAAKVSDVFPSNNSFPVKVTWYSGNLTLNVGESQGYWREKILKLKDGNILTVEDVKHKVKPVLPINGIVHWATILFAPIVFYLIGFLAQKKDVLEKKRPFGLKVITSILIAEVLANLLYLFIDIIYTRPGYYIDNGNLHVEPATTLAQRLLGSIGFFVIGSAVPAILSFGLLKLKNWARIGLVCVAILMLLANLISVFFMPTKIELVQAAIIIFSAGCLIYFLRPQMRGVFKRE